ncbi:uncharacterized protein LOC132697121 [Cylas formicarius]|uniref:uncharacterized protein LOC132697121 n=1 Tax=Cylas formicarius TaxID=197179 RepID=UPI002958A5A8|nr:uncharacterized protein LOC132697121 [Cylas formicarius]
MLFDCSLDFHRLHQSRKLKFNGFWKLANDCASHFRSGIVYGEIWIGADRRPNRNSTDSTLNCHFRELKSPSRNSGREFGNVVRPACIVGTKRNRKGTKRAKNGRRPSTLTAAHVHVIALQRWSWVICRQRYRTAAAKQRAQFIKEINRHELLQIKALDGVRIHRGFSNPVICQAKPKELVQLTAKQRMRIEDILERPF